MLLLVLPGVLLDMRYQRVVLVISDFGPAYVSTVIKYIKYQTLCNYMIDDRYIFGLALNTQIEFPKSIAYI